MSGLGYLGQRTPHVLNEYMLNAWKDEKCNELVEPIHSLTNVLDTFISARSQTDSMKNWVCDIVTTPLEEIPRVRAT